MFFVCTANSARSHLAAALWRRASTVPAASAGTHPANAIAAGAIAAAGRHHLPLRRLRPRHIAEVQQDGDLVVTVCDLAHEKLGQRPAVLWSVPDRSRPGTRQLTPAAWPPSMSAIAIAVGMWRADTVSTTRPATCRTPSAPVAIAATARE